jgi:hypothetical protein
MSVEMNGHAPAISNGRLPDRESIRDFLALLWPVESLPGRITICHRDHNGEFRGAGFCSTVDEAAGLAAECAVTSCVWMSVGLLRPGLTTGRGCSNDVVALPGVWAEIDYGKPGAPPDIETALAIVAAMPLRPTIIVHTGHGIHCYWLFHELMELPGSAERGLAQSYLLGWRDVLNKELKKRGYGNADSIYDLARVLRPVGTENCKDASNRLPVICLDYNETTRYLPEDFEQYIPEPKPPEELKEPNQAVDDPVWIIRPGDDFNNRASWPEVAELIGWKCTARRGGGFELLRNTSEKYGAPSSKFTATVGYKGRDRATVFSGNCGLKCEVDEAGRRSSYSKFELFAAVAIPSDDRPGEGDFKAAAQLLAKHGFGEKRPFVLDPNTGIGKRDTAAPSVMRPTVPRISVRQLQEENSELHPVVIDQWLREGETGNLISGSKIGKSWLIYYILICYVTMRPIFDRFATSGGRALLIDNELHKPTLASRLKTVADAMGVRQDEYADLIDVMSLRGNLRSIFELAQELKDVPHGYYKLIVLDAKYRALGADSDENSNRDETRFYDEEDRIADQTGAAFLNVHHSTKGLQGDKRVTDAGAGGGAQSRAADAHLVLRDHQEEGVVVLDAAVRSFKPLKPIALRWAFPLWIPDESLDTTQLKGKGGASGERQHGLNDGADAAVLDSCQAWRSINQIADAKGMGRPRITKAVNRLLERGMLNEDTQNHEGNDCKVYRKSIHAGGAGCTPS